MKKQVGMRLGEARKSECAKLQKKLHMNRTQVIEKAIHDYGYSLLQQGILLQEDWDEYLQISEAEYK